MCCVLCFVMCYAARAKFAIRVRFSLRDHPCLSVLSVVLSSLSATHSPRFRPRKQYLCLFVLSVFKIETTDFTDFTDKFSSPLASRKPIFVLFELFVFENISVLSVLSVFVFCPPSHPCLSVLSVVLSCPPHPIPTFPSQETTFV